MGKIRGDKLLDQVKRKGVFTISLDFELYWGVRDVNTLDARRDALLGARQAVIALLDLFEKYNIHATWATVGFLFFDSSKELMAGAPRPKPSYLNQNLSPYEYAAALNDNEDSALFHFAPALIKKILNVPHQELATHTFSHYYCLEDGQTPDDFRADLVAAMQAAEKYQCKLESLVFPRNQSNSDYLKICGDLGILAYRGNESAWFYHSGKRSLYRNPIQRGLRLMDSYLNISGCNTYPVPPAGELPINIPSSCFLRSYSSKLRFLEPLRLKRIISSMAAAAREGRVYHLWWHPEGFGLDLQENLAFLEKIFLAFNKLENEYGMLSLTMGEIAQVAMNKKTYPVQRSAL